MVRDFQLITWENTQEFRERLADAVRRGQEAWRKLYARGFSCTMHGDAESSWDGGYHFWVNSSSPGWHYPRTAEQAIEVAAKTGVAGYWSLEELEKFADPERYQTSRVFVQAMWELGFRPSSRRRVRWAKRKKDEEQPDRPELNTEWIGRSEFDQRYANLLVAKNGAWANWRSFSIEATSGGMVFTYLDINPLTENLSRLGSGLASRSHIARKQEGCLLTARNLVVGKGEEAERYVVIRIEPETGEPFEVVWPSKVSSDVEGKMLLRDLEDRIAQALGLETVTA